MTTKVFRDWPYRSAKRNVCCEYNLLYAACVFFFVTRPGFRHVRSHRRLHESKHSRMIGVRCGNTMFRPMVTMMDTPTVENQDAEKSV